MAFDYQIAADLVQGKRITGEEARAFVHSVKSTHDQYESLKTVLTDLRAELAKREAEIAMLKGMLLELEGNDEQSTDR